MPVEEEEVMILASRLYSFILEFSLVPKPIFRALLLKSIYNERNSKRTPFVYYVTYQCDIILVPVLCDKGILAFYFGANIGCCDCKISCFFLLPIENLLMWT
jgi:hypothetical protein